MRTAKPATRRLPYVLRIVRARPRLFVAAAVGLVVGLALPPSWQPATRLLMAWDIAVTLYLILVFELMARAEVERIRHHASIEDEGQLGILMLSVVAALASLGAIIVKLGSSAVSDSDRQPAELVLAILTIVVSWAFIHTIFALHYAHQHYGDPGEGAGGLMFPGKGKPDYWDFLYFALVIGMTCQVSDVEITTKPTRHAATAHGVLSFFFNTALLALTINIAANAI